MQQLKPIATAVGLLSAGVMAASGIPQGSAEAWYHASLPKALQSVNAELYAPAIPQRSAIDVTATAPETVFNPLAQIPKGFRAVSPASVAGEGVMTYRSLTTTNGDDGVSCTVKTIAGTDSIAIENFWSTGVTAKGKIDTATGTLTIPAQELYVHTTYGSMWLALCGSDGKPNYNTAITGTVSADGTITIPTWWGVFVKSGKDAGAFMYAGWSTEIVRANGTMTCTADGTGAVTTYNVVVSQPQMNNVEILNFGNHGQTVSVSLNSALEASIAGQSVMDYPQNGAPFYSYAYTEYTNNNGSISISGLSNPIIVDKATSAKVNTLSWGKWTALSSGTNGRVLLGAWKNSKVTTTLDIEYPQFNVSGYKGQGTAADPYQISTLADLVYMSEQVNASSENKVGNYYKIYKDKHFKLMNDIDMGTYQFTPIGADGYRMFAGTFDGGGHTISNLIVNEPSKGYNGLFGQADTVSLIKNINLVNPNVTGGGIWTAGLCGYSRGKVENVHVTGGTIINTNAATGAVCGSLYVGDNLHVDGTAVIGYAGWTGGITGEVYESLTNSDVVNSTVRGSAATGYSLGGVAGSIYGTGSNLYFMGQLDGQYIRPADNVGVRAGGVVGMLTGSLSNSFAVGSVTGYGSYSMAGGVAGQVMGGSMDNCYFRGYVFTNFSRKTGGLVGYVAGQANNGATVTSSFSNLYVAATVRGEDYQYNKETGRMETLGTVDEGAIAKAENIYYDRQVYTHNSSQYTGLSTAEMTAAAGLKGFSADKWLFTANQYPRLKTFAETQAAQMSASAIIFNSTGSVNKVNQSVLLTPMGNTEFMFYVNGKLSKKGHFAEIVGDSLKISTEFGIDTLFFINGKSNFYYELNIAPVPFEGFGTQESPYLISTKKDLEVLSQITTINKQYFPATYFEQTNDIDLEYSEDFIGLASDGADAHSQFAGNYNGKGYTIHRMKIGGLVWKTAPSESNNWLGTPSTSGTEKSEAYKGFIGRLNAEGVLRNLNFAADCDAKEVWASVGLAVGSNNGLIDSVRNYADIKGVSCWVGGIAGMNEATGRITNCYNAGDVTSGYNTAGGVAGKNDGVVENCANAGNVSVVRWANFGKDGSYNTVGGVVPVMAQGVVKNVMNVGTVTGQNAVGGIVGNLTKVTTANPRAMNDVLGALNIGTVRCDNKAGIGAVGGLNAGTATVTTGTVVAFFDEQIVPYGAVANQPYEGAVGMTTAALTSGAAIEGLDPAFWQFDKGMYPVLKLFADEPKLQAARKMLLTLPEGVTTGDMTADATLSGADKWTVDPTTYFTIDGNTVKTGAPVSTVVEAVVTGSNAAFTRPFDIRRTPAVPLQGKGTEAEPYLISNATDWNNLANFINSVSEGFEGKFLKVSADIEFNKNFQPLFVNAVDFLLGTLDGDNHTISGIEYTPVDTYQAPICKVGTTGVIKNLTFKGSVTSAKANVGGVTAKVYGTISNVTSEMNVTLTSGSGASAFGTLYKGAVMEKVVNKGKILAPTTYVGGLAAQAEGGVTFTACGNEGQIVSSYAGTSTSTQQSIGGLVGASGPNVFTDCYNKGTFTFKTPATMYGVGGLVGTANSDSSIPEGMRMTGCWNEADIEAGWQIGGLIAFVNASATVPNPLILTDCYNTGNITSNVTASKSSTCIAGLAAHFTPGTQVTNCYNTGNITQSAKQTYAAGLIGYYKVAPTEALPMTITNCYNTGKVDAAGNQGGGIIAYTHNYTTITDCWNEGEITGGFGLGGITANLGSASAKLVRCYNVGTISSAKNRAGGLWGWNGTKATVEDCFNAGRVEITIDPVAAANGNLTDGYGAGGLGGSSSATIIRCYNMGTVAGKCQVGGLVGVPAKGATNFTSCYNAGAIEAPADTCGSIVGVSLTNNGKVWNDANTITDCYYIDAKLKNDIAGTAMTEAELAALKMGEGWNNGDRYTYPMISGFAPDVAKVNAARVILSESDMAAGVITGYFHVGMPEGLEWTASTPVVGFGDIEKEGYWKENYTGDLTLTATAGEATRTVTFKADAKATGIDSVEASDVVSVEVYTTTGLRINAADCVPGAVYVVVTRYADGRTTTARKAY